MGPLYLVDLSIAYELVRHNLAAWKAREVGFPLVVARMALLQNGSRRVIKIGRACSLPIRTSTLIVAGCDHATAFLKAILLGTADSITET